MPLIERPLMRVLVGAVALGIGISACKETITEPITVAAVVVNGGGGTLRLGQSVQLSTTLKSTEGWTLPNVGVSWASSDAAKANISSAGQVTAVSRGPVTLTASAGGVNGTAAVTVIGVQSIALAPETLSVIVTQTRPMTATTVLDPGVTVTPTWRSLDTTIARVDTTGRVTARTTTGFARVEVTAEDKKDTAVVRVVPVPVVSVVVSPDTATRTVGQTLQLTATPKDSIGGTLTGRVTTWTSSDTARASVTSAGLVTVKAAGTATITAAVEGKTGSAALTLKVPVSSVSISPTNATLTVGATLQFSAVTKDSNGNFLASRTVTWTSSDTTKVKVSNTGLATAIAAGVATVTAGSEGKTAIGNVQVRLEPGLRAYYPLDGNARDVSGNGQDGVVEGATPSADRFNQPNRAYRFAGGTQRIAIGDINLTGAFSLSAWIKRDSLTAGGAGIVSRFFRDNSKGWELYTPLAGGCLVLHTRGTRGSSAATCSDTIFSGIWYHVAATYDGVSTGRLYIDGVEVGSKTGLLPDTTFTGYSAYIGFTAWESTNGFVGSVDDVKIYERQLSIEELQAISQDRPSLSSVKIDSATVIEGGEVSLRVRVTNSVGNDMAKSNLQWASLDESNATVDHTGRVTGRNPGQVRIVARVGAIADTVMISVQRRERLAMSVEHSCAINTGNSLYCWGKNSAGEFGNNASSANSQMAILSGNNAKFVSISAGQGFTCGIGVDRKTYCWGANSEGQLGNGSTVDQLAPSLVLGNHDFTSVQSDYNFACGLTSGAKIYCWGSNGYGQIGNGVNNAGPVIAPSLVAGNLLFAELAVGAEHACGRTFAGSVHCWGSGGWSQLGDGTAARVAWAPVKVFGETKFTAIFAAVHHTCGITQDGSAFCWGLNLLGSLGDGSEVAKNFPKQVLGDYRYKKLAMGENFTCGISINDKLICWGGGSFGQLANGLFEQRLSPTLSVTSYLPVQITGGQWSACSLADDGNVYCWGRNSSGQLGDGTVVNRSIPTRIIGFVR